MLNYAFISWLAIIKLVEWGGKSFSQSTDLTETSYISQHLTYMTSQTVKLKLRKKFELRI